MKTFQDKVDEMIDVVIKLKWNYTIFCALFEKQAINAEARQEHQEFFLTMHDALLCSFFVAADLLFSEKSSATSLRNLIKDIGVQKPDVGEKLNRRIPVGKRGLIGQIGIMRNQVFAHRWNEKSPDAVFIEAKVKLRTMKVVTDLVQFIVYELAQEAGGERRGDLEKQQLSDETLQRVADDASLVMRAFA